MYRERIGRAPRARDPPGTKARRVSERASERASTPGTCASMRAYFPFFFLHARARARVRTHSGGITSPYAGERSCTYRYTIGGWPRERRPPANTAGVYRLTAAPRAFITRSGESRRCGGGGRAASALQRVTSRRLCHSRLSALLPLERLALIELNFRRSSLRLKKNQFFTKRKERKKGRSYTTRAQGLRPDDKNTGIKIRISISLQETNQQRVKVNT